MGPLLIVKVPEQSGREKWYTWTFMTWCCHIELPGPIVVWAPRHAHTTSEFSFSEREKRQYGVREVVGHVGKELFVSYF